MIIIFIWTMTFDSCLHSFCLSIFILLGIFILLILPIFWNINTIILKIITNCFSIFISYFWIMLLFISWYFSISCLFKCKIVSIFIHNTIPFTWYFHIFRLIYIVNCFSIITLYISIMFPLVWNINFFLS